MDDRQFLTSILYEASEIARGAFIPFRQISASVKDSDSNQVLTEADTAIAALLKTRIRKAFPGDGIIEEESGYAVEPDSQRVWVIDPVDGTSNFAQGLPLFGIMVGLMVDGKPVAAGIAIPSSADTFTALKGEGTFRNLAERVHVTDEPQLVNCLVSYSLDGHREDPELTKIEGTTVGALALAVRNIRASNSCYDAVMVATGVYGAYINRSQRIWDNIPIQLIIEEAGGTVTDISGDALAYPLRKAGPDTAYSIVGAAPQLHPQLMDILKRTG